MWSVLLLLLENEMTLVLTFGRRMFIFRVSKGLFWYLLRSVKITFAGKVLT